MLATIAQSARIRVSMRRILVVSVSLLVLASPLQAQSGRGGGQRARSGPGTGNVDEHLVPWKFLPTGAELVKGPVVLYWLPASLEEMKRSPLLTSHELLQDATRCVSLEIIAPDDVAAIDKLDATGRLPMALLVDNHGSVIRTVHNIHGVLRAASVEQMVTDELSARDAAVYLEITEAKRRASMGEKERSIDLYKKVWDDRCLFPLVGSEAQRALKDLGVIVHDTSTPPPVDPNLPVTKPTTTAPATTHTSH